MNGRLGLLVIASLVTAATFRPKTEHAPSSRFWLLGARSTKRNEKFDRARDRLFEKPAPSETLAARDA